MNRLDTSARSAASALIEHRFPWRWSLADLASVKKNGLKVFSCFSCGGGSSMGYKLAGFDVIGCCELDPAMMKIYKRNNHPRLAYEMDVRDLLRQDLPAELYNLDILDGSPPCSVFSMAGEREAGWNKNKQFREGQKLQRLDDLFFEFIKIAECLQPKVVIAENVRGLLNGNAKGYVNEIVKAFREAGYDVQIFLFNAAKMGVPQIRERVFFVARRKDLELQKLVINFDEPMVLFGDVRSERGKPIGGIAGEMLKHRRESDNDLSDVSKRLRRVDAGFTAPINRDSRPAYTVTSGGVAYRMCDGLAMTDQDFINCQTFPQDYDFMDQSVKYVCGMSVPPVMMANVATAVYEQLFKGAKNGER